MSKNLKKRIYTSITLILILSLMLINQYALGYFLLVAGIISILEFSKMNLIIFDKKKLKQFLTNILFIIYIFCYCYLFLFFSSFLQLKILIFTILLTCVASDLGGYIFGKTFKGAKLTRISPKKTISGAIGSLIFSCIFILSLIYFLTKNFDPLIVIVGLTTSVACQLGDLFFSLLKRKSFIKDTGNFLPGHGGVLDRIDSILLGVPVGFITLLIIY